MRMYCERDTAGWFAEPLNTVSGFAFFISAWQAWRQLEGARLREQWDLHLLAGLIGLVGVASMLWHASGIGWLRWFDAAAVAAFVLAYWQVFLVRVSRLGWAGLVVGWLLTGAGLALFYLLLPRLLLGSTLVYAPLLLLLLTGIVMSMRVDRRLARDLFLASILFLLAMVVRAADLLLCEWVIVGTHWLWHLLTAGLLFVLVDGMIRHVRLRETQVGNDAG
ncbi:ceramidase domain-containing protein [Thioalkalivibrio sp.]|uniref:ceramidase domain-containing protein n=1 Tax=Thioalkalivibrio sp. TaxID=2093813 RepID=UPI003975D10D